MSITVPATAILPMQVAATPVAEDEDEDDRLSLGLHSNLM